MSSCCSKGVGRKGVQPLFICGIVGQKGGIVGMVEKNMCQPLAHVTQIALSLT